MNKNNIISNNKLDTRNSNTTANSTISNPFPLVNSTSGNSIDGLSSEEQQLRDGNHFNPTHSDQLMKEEERQVCIKILMLRKRMLLQNY